MKLFAGKYQHGPNDIRTISFDNGFLYSQRGNGQRYKLLAMSNNRFFFDDEPEVQIQFQPNKNELRIHYRIGMNSLAKQIKN